MDPLDAAEDGLPDPLSRAASSDDEASSSPEPVDPLDAAEEGTAEPFQEDTDPLPVLTPKQLKKVVDKAKTFPSLPTAEKAPHDFTHPARYATENRPAHRPKSYGKFRQI